MKKTVWLLLVMGTAAFGQDFPGSGEETSEPVQEDKFKNAEAWTCTGDSLNVRHMRVTLFADRKAEIGRVLRLDRREKYDTSLTVAQGVGIFWFWPDKAINAIHAFHMPTGSDAALFIPGRSGVGVERSISRAVDHAMLLKGEYFFCNKSR
ncbi:MAG: hypothetical protein F4186_10435 [Boseongicola sp. SB0676_bin_33]|nr:hypothetical protein [Boseongicola sp. SB0676_bin_33]